MDPIADLSGAMPLQPSAPAPEPIRANPSAGADSVTVGGGTDAAISDADIQRYTEVAAGFVSQMYMTMWREAQRNAG